MLIAGIIGSFIFTDEVRLTLMNPNIEKSIYIIVLRTIIPFYGITYIILSVLEAKKYHHRLKENYSNIEKLKLNWLMYLIFGIGLVWLLELIQIILIDIARKPENIAYQYIYTAVSILIYMVTYKSLKQPEVFREVELKEKEIDEELSAAEEYSSYLKSGLTEISAQKILNHLLEIMEKDKPYLKSNLSLTDLSAKLGTSTHNLSEVINTKLNRSFYDFVNNYRVNEVKKMLKDKNYDSYPVLSIAFEAGFNSKSTFNNIFKKIAGVTPTEFRRSHNN
jgi:AraC-like DNA-binding protein